MNNNEILIAFPNDNYIGVKIESFSKGIKKLEANKEFDDCVFAWVGKTYFKFEKKGFIQLKDFIDERNRTNSPTNL
jgi:hypothetical protein